MAATTIDRLHEIQMDRMNEFRAFGLNATSGKYLGAVQFSATDSGKLLRLLRRLRKLEAK